VGAGQEDDARQAGRHGACVSPLRMPGHSVSRGSSFATCSVFTAQTDQSLSSCLSASNTSASTWPGRRARDLALPSCCAAQRRCCQ
jgi:hypothetical protein